MYTNSYPELLSEWIARKTPSSSAVIERLKALHPLSIDLSLARMRRLLQALKHPERRLPPVVHVAGTNGKGSLIAYMRAIAEALGKRVHVYTSPHLVNFHERIVLAAPLRSMPIAEDTLLDCLMRAESANDGDMITLFEITTAAALLAFSETPADFLLLETGMGGRLDATNVVDRPVATAITPISIDHVSFLGNTLPAIADEKAGILKCGVTSAVGMQPPEVLQVLEVRAAEIGAPLLVFGRDFDVCEAKDGFIFQSGQRMLELPLPRLKGKHQIANAGTAVATACLTFGDSLPIHALERGLTNVEWPARFEHLRSGTLYDYVADDTEIWLDGGHNPAGGRVISQALGELEDASERDLHLVWGMMESKDAKAVIRAFKGLVKRVYTVPIPGESNSFSPQVLAEIATIEGLEAVAAKSVPHALLLSQMALARKGRVLIFGSLHLAGHVLKLHAS